MTVLLTLLLLASLAANVVLVWYTRKLIQNMYFGVNNIDEMQKMLNEYAELLEPVASMENYYGDPAITAAVANTKLVVEACKVFKKTIIKDYDEENQENEEGEGEEGLKETAQKGNQEASKETPRKAEATIGKVGP